MVYGGHWRPLKLLLIKSTTVKLLRRASHEEIGAICQNFINLPSGGHRGQTMLPYDPYHDAPFWKAGSMGFSMVCMVKHIKLLLRP